MQQRLYWGYNVKVSNIHNIEDAYNELLHDIFGEITSDSVITKHYATMDIAFDITTTERKQDLIDKLCQFAISVDAKQIISRRYGLQSGKPETLTAIGNSMGYSAEHIRNVIRESLRKLKHRLNIISVYTLFSK